MVKQGTRILWALWQLGGKANTLQLMKEVDMYTAQFHENANLLCSRGLLRRIKQGRRQDGTNLPHIWEFREQKIPKIIHIFRTELGVEVINANY